MMEQVLYKMDEYGHGKEYDRRRLAGNPRLEISLTGWDAARLRQMCILAGVGMVGRPGRLAAQTAEAEGACFRPRLRLPQVRGRRGGEDCTPPAGEARDGTGGMHLPPRRYRHMRFR
jgi:hypothetical protein